MTAGDAGARVKAPVGHGFARESRSPARAPVVVWKNIGVMRGLAICLVVVHHTTHWVYGTRRLVLATQPMAPWEGLLEVCGRALPPVSVPVFLFASGYFAGRFASNWEAARKGAYRVATRYVAWSAAGFAFFLLTRQPLNTRQIPVRFLFGGPFMAYWFFPVIIQLLLLAPLLVRWCASHPRWMIAIAALLQAFCIGGYYTMVFRGLPRVPSYGRNGTMWC